MVDAIRAKRTLLGFAVVVVTATSLVIPLAPHFWAVASAGVIGAACSTLLRAPDSGFVAMNRVVVNGSVSKLAHGRGGTQLLSFNDHAHLEHGGPELMTYR